MSANGDGMGGPPDKEMKLRSAQLTEAAALAGISGVRQHNDASRFRGKETACLERIHGPAHSTASTCSSADG